MAPQQPQNNKSQGEKTLLTALLLSSPGPLITGISAAISLSTTQLADFLRRSTELVAIFMSWLIYRKLQHADLGAGEQQRLERLSNLLVGGAMGCTGAMMLLLAAVRLSTYKPGGSVTLGLVIAVLGLLTNTWFWFRYRALAREQFDAVIAGQRELYRAKSCVDLCVVIALSAVAVAPLHPATRYVDLLGSVIVACYLLWNGVSMVRQQLKLPMGSQ